MKPDKLSSAWSLAVMAKTERLCPLCDGTGEILERKARQMGYTFAPDEPLDSLEEKIIPCPACKGNRVMSEEEDIK